MRTGFLALGLALAACQAAPVANNTQQAPAARVSPAGLDLIALTIESGGRNHAFTVEVARSEAQQERGLMERRTLAGDAGMLFPFDPPRPASFWMRNTLIPLDIIYIREDGSIARIVTAKPLDATPIPSGEPIAAVLEIGGGRAAQLGIKQGDIARW